MRAVGLYIHIPFCHSKCHYCDFCSRPSRGEEEQKRLVERLKEEYEARCGDTIGKEIFHPTVYLGGGTPSSLPLKLLERIFSFIDFTGTREVTVEVNPEDVTSELARFLANIPGGRVSMGVQSLNDAELRAVGRRHSAARAIEAYTTLRDAGVTNISLDLIYGLPGQTDESWEHTLNTIFSLCPDHLSSYLLSFESGTLLYRRLQAGDVTELPQDECHDRYNALCSTASVAGMEHYEISSFALPGRRSLHNSSYWNGTSYVGLGPGAHSFDSLTLTRSFNRPAVGDYIAEGHRSTLTLDDETSTQRINDYIITRLRRLEGLSFAEMSSLFNPEEARELKQRADKHVKEQLMEIINNGDTLIIPERHWLISDSILVDLIK